MPEHTQPAPDPVASPAPASAVAARRVRRLLTRVPTVASRRHRGRRPVSDTQERLAFTQASGGRLGSTSRQLSGSERSGGNTASHAASVVSQRVRAAVLAEYHAENARRARDAVAELIRAGYTGRQVRVAGRAVAPEEWVRSAPGAHQPLVDDATFARAQHRAPRSETTGYDTTGLGRAA